VVVTRNAWFDIFVPIACGTHIVFLVYLGANILDFCQNEVVFESMTRNMGVALVRDGHDVHLIKSLRVLCVHETGVKKVIMKIIEMKTKMDELYGWTEVR
jgi:hypothetical protein